MRLARVAVTPVALPSLALSWIVRLGGAGLWWFPEVPRDGGPGRLDATDDLVEL